jgi:hypothetical protein
MIGDIMIVVMGVARIVIGVSLTRTASRQNVRNLFWLAAVFYINGLFSVFYIQALYNLPIFLGGVILAQVCLVLFVQRTFYRDRSSPWRIFMVITLAGGLAILWLGANNSAEANLSALMSTVAACNWLWHVVIAVGAYRAAAPDRAVEDWVKARYRLMIAYCCLMMLSTALGGIISVLEIAVIAIQAPIGLITLISIVLQYLVWVMPSGFRQYLNRNYQAAQDIATLSEEEIMRQLQGE